MEVDEIQAQVSKFQRISSNAADNCSNLQKIASTHKGNFDEDDDDDGGGGGGGGISGVGRFCGWPSSRIVRVSRASGGKDRHSKVLTSKGLRDRRVRLSVTTAIQFYDLQDRLGYDQPSKAVEWLLKAAATSIAELPSLEPTFSHNKTTRNDAEFEDPNHQHQSSNHNNVSMSKSSACSSTSETSKGSGLSLSRSENRIKARERAREMAAKKEKEKESDSVADQINGISQNSSFTDLLTGGGGVNCSTVASPESRMHWTSPVDYFLGGRPQMPQFNMVAGDNHHPQHQFSFLQENFTPVPVATSAGGGGGVVTGFNRGTLQSNVLSFLPQHHPHMQRFQPYGSTSTNFPFFMAPNSVSVPPDQYPETGYDSLRLQPCYGGGDGGGRHSDHHKEKTKN